MNVRKMNIKTKVNNFIYTASEVFCMQTRLKIQNKLQIYLYKILISIFQLSLNWISLRWMKLSWMTIEKEEKKKTDEKHTRIGLDGLQIQAICLIRCYLGHFFKYIHKNWCLFDPPENLQIISYTIYFSSSHH